MGRKTAGRAKRSPLAKKLIIVNILLLAGFALAVLAVSPNRAAMIAQEERALKEEAALYAQLLGSGTFAPELLPLGQGLRLRLADGQEFSGPALAPPAVFTPISDILAKLSSQGAKQGQEPLAELLQAEAPQSGHLFEGAGKLLIGATAGEGERKVLLLRDGSTIEAQMRLWQERLMRAFAVAALVSVAVSLYLARMIARPIVHLAAAAEGGDGDKAAARVSLPDMADRPDEIGRLSVALRGMVAALYERIDSNEQFAADVAHEIKNPLASLRSAVGSLRMVKKEEHRERLLEVIEHDVRRLDRLVTDISNASRLDSELVKEKEEQFDLSVTLRNLCDYMGEQAAEKGIDFLRDLPPEVVMIKGLEGRLAQVFVNLLANAISFCERGDALRIWLRRRDTRVLVVVEDTGPGIPEEALSNIFKRFYSDRPASHFGNNSGLGLSISKQIVEAHGGVIWAENIRAKDASPESAPLGARFVVGLPV